VGWWVAAEESMETASKLIERATGCLKEVVA
jgi:hypothetical protein